MTRSRATQAGAALLLAFFLAACGSTTEDVAGDVGDVGEAAQDVAGDATDVSTASADDTDPSDGVDAEGTTAEGTDADTDPSDGVDTGSDDVDDDTNTSEDDVVVDAVDTVEAGTDTTEPDAVTEFAGPGDDDGVVGPVADELSDADLVELVTRLDAADPEAAAACIRNEATIEGMTLSSDASEAIVIGLIRCDGETMREVLYEGFGELDTSGIAATPAQIDCVFDATVNWLATLPLSSTGIFDGDAPQEVVNAIVDECDVSERDARFLLDDT